MKPLCAGSMEWIDALLFPSSGQLHSVLFFSMVIKFYVIARIFLGLFLRILLEKDIPCLCCKFFFFMRKKCVVQKFVVQIDSEIILNLKMEEIPENTFLIRKCQLKVNSALATQDSFTACKIWPSLCTLLYL